MKTTEEKPKGKKISAGDFWYWHGDGLDNLESITCPILIPAEMLRQLLADRKLSSMAALRNMNSEGMVGEFIWSLRKGPDDFGMLEAFAGAIADTLEEVLRRFEGTVKCEYCNEDFEAGQAVWPDVQAGPYHQDCLAMAEEDSSGADPPYPI